MLHVSYYAQNYAGIIRHGLVAYISWRLQYLQSTRGGHYGIWRPCSEKSDWCILYNYTL